MFIINSDILPRSLEKPSRPIRARASECSRIQYEHHLAVLRHDVVHAGSLGYSKVCSNYTPSNGTISFINSVPHSKMSRPRSVADDSELLQYNKDSDVSSMSHQQKNEIVMADEDDASADMILDTLNNESYVTCLAEPNNRKRQQPQSHNGEINCPKIEPDATDDSASSLYGRETTPVRQPIRKKKRLEKSSVEENFATFLKDMTGVIANKSTQSTSTDAREEPSLFVQLLEEKMNQLPPNERMKMEISLLSQINTRLCVQNDPLDSHK